MTFNFVINADGTVTDLATGKEITVKDMNERMREARKATQSRRTVELSKERAAKTAEREAARLRRVRSQLVKATKRERVLKDAQDRNKKRIVALNAELKKLGKNQAQAA
jgi:hypothetical protein